MRVRLGVLAAFMAALALSACSQEAETAPQDQKLRAWATTVDDWMEAVHDWQNDVVLPALVAYCELERKVYDTLHTGQNPVDRFCPAGGTEPVNPPEPPPDWDS